MYSVGFEVQRMKGASSWIHGWVKTTIFTDICLYRYIIIIIELAPLRHPLDFLIRIYLRARTSVALPRTPKTERRTKTSL